MSQEPRSRTDIVTAGAFQRQTTVRAPGTEDDSTPVVEAIVGMSHAMRLRVVLTGA
jgi:hypothetical protein